MTNDDSGDKPVYALRLADGSTAKILTFLPGFDRLGRNWVTVVGPAGERLTALMSDADLAERLVAVWRPDHHTSAAHYASPDRGYRAPVEDALDERPDTP